MALPKWAQDFDEYLWRQEQAVVDHAIRHKWQNWEQVHGIVSGSRHFPWFCKH